MYLVASLTTPNEQTAPVIVNQPISSPNTDEDSEEGVKFCFNLVNYFAYLQVEDGQASKGEEHFRSVQTLVVLKRGDKVFEEGDLFQRVYTLTSGTLAVYQNGVFLHNINEGQVFGYDPFLYKLNMPVV